jgi:hypothetical protein
MKLSAAVVRAAVAEHVDVSLAEALRLPETVDDADVGLYVARALGIGGEDPGLTVVSVAPPGEPWIVLGPEEALSHPLIGPWISRSLISALASSLVAGTRACLAGLAAPELGGLTIHHRRGEIVGGSMELGFPANQGQFAAIAAYGATLTCAPLLTSLRINAQALADAGGAMRRGLQLWKSSEAGVFPEGAATIH